MAGDALPENWRLSTLGEVADPKSKAIVSGPFGSNIGSRFFVKQGVPVIRGNNLTTDMTRFVDDGFVFVTEAKADELGNCGAVIDDLIFTAAGSLGQVGIIPRAAKYPRYIISNKQLRARIDKSKVDPLFAFYWFSSREMVEYVKQRNTGSSVPLINLSVLRSLPLPLPPLAEQRAVAHILGTLDDKIELNRRMNETLEAMARALFKSWFVDFDPVRAKVEGRAPGLPKRLADLFPDSFEDSELGEIPKGWEVGTLADFASLNPESWSKQTRPEIIKYVDLSNTKWGHIEAVTGYAQQDAPSRAQRVLRQDDTIVGTVRPGNGSYAFISVDGLTGSTGFAVLRPRRTEYAQFIYLAATIAENIEALAHLADGGAYPAVRPEVVIATQVVRPSDQVLERFSMLNGSFFARMAENELESRNLVALRDSLLPKLISGELRVKDAEKIVEPA